MIVKITEPALENLEKIKEFIAQDSVYYAKIFSEKVLSSIEILGDFPRIGRIVPEFNTETIREIIYGDYRILYKIIDSEDILYILTVIHGSRKLKKHIRKKDLNNH
jgi:addiction module RelE/StbE family toxin